MYNEKLNYKYIQLDSSYRQLGIVFDGAALFLTCASLMPRQAGAVGTTFISLRDTQSILFFKLACRIVRSPVDDFSVFLQTRFVTQCP
jgi:hypothetical protein